MMGRVLIPPGHRVLPARISARTGQSGVCHPIREQVCAAWVLGIAVVVNHDSGDEDPAG